MDVSEAIRKRCSIRQFRDGNGVIPDDKIRRILEAARWASSPFNIQPWEFIIIKNKETLEELSLCSPFARAVKNAPLVIVMCGDLSLDRHGGFWVQDCSAATENMLLQIADLGLGSVWLGLYPLQERVDYVKKQFSLPETVIPFAILPVGFPAKEMNPSDRFNPDRVHYETW